MKNWKKWLSVGLAALVISIGGSCAGTVWAGPLEPYNRVQMVAPGQRTPVTEDDDEVSPKAWQKIDGVCYNGSGERIPGAITRGIDVSEWQDEINWRKVIKSNVDFAMVRISYGPNYIDKLYDYNMEEANKAGMPVGTYVYSTAITKEHALKEAQLAIRKMKGYKVSYPVVYDLEYPQMGKLTPREISELALVFCNEVKKAGYYPMIYCNTHWYSRKVDLKLLSGLDVWIASYGDKIQAPSREKYDYTIWQATDGDGGGVLNPTKGLIDGISEYCNVDVNFGYVDYTKKIIPRTGPLSTYSPSKKPSIHPIDKPSQEDEDQQNENQPDEEIIKNGWVEENGKTYYYKDGQPIKGTRKIGKHYYCFSSKDGSLFRNTLLYSSSTNRTCYADDQGIRVSNTWVKVNGKRYYMGADGYAFKGSRYVHGKYYLFDSKRGFAFTNRKRITNTGDIYYYGEDGARLNKGFAQIRENGEIHTYYFNRQGKAYKKWHKIRGKWYYFYPGWTENSGVRAENVTLTLNGKVCVFDENGVCISGT